VRLTEKSTLSTVALTVGDALRGSGIHGVLTGGACVSLYTRGPYHSTGVDFVLSGVVHRDELDEALATVGFQRSGDRYDHPTTLLYVEFPPGPLAIGGDLEIKPVEIRRARLRTLALSATDCCRDRLAAYYHWNDRQSLRAAVLVALVNRMQIRRIEEWSRGEGAGSRFEEFREELKQARNRRRRAGR